MLTYELPRELIAQQPCDPRDSARLLVLDRASNRISHRIFRELPEFLRPGDCLVLNDTKVVPARLFGRRADTGGKVELLLLSPHPDPLPQGERVKTYRCLGKPGRGLKLGTRLSFNHGSLKAEVVSVEGQERLIRFEGTDPRFCGDDVAFKWGEVPLPPYIRRPADPQDVGWYQTVFAKEPGAVAAPTAGLHFTEELLDRIRQRGVRIAFVTLHVGWGTFKPVGERELETGKLRPEKFKIPLETLRAIQETKRNGSRVIAVGTTVVRTLEAFALRQAQGERQVKVPGRPDPHGSTDLFIRPPFQFRVVDALITNFHLPGTSLLLLVTAFAGEGSVRTAYEEAIRQRYRFYSYGDGMLIF